MDDSSNSGSLVYSRRKLREVPLELFKTAAVKPVRALDLGYNALQAPAVAALGDEEVDPENAVNRAARAAYNASGAKKGAAGPPSLKAAAFAVKGLLEGMIPKPKLKHIETLYLTHNLLQQLPDAVSNLRTLKQLWLNANSLAELPASISVLVNLEILSCSNNAITRVRGEIGCCESLTQLLLRCNRLGLASDNSSAVLPEHLGLLTKLKVLDLAENRLNTLPIELGRLHTSLMRLNLEANAWRFPPQPTVDLGKERVLEFLLQLYESKLERYRAKAQDRLRALREQPEQLGYTREEANALVAKAAASKLSDKHGPGHPSFKLYAPLEVDSGLKDF